MPTPLRFLPRCFLCLAFLCVLTIPAARADPGDPAARLGKKIDNIPFTPTAGRPFHLYDLVDRKAVVVVFLSFDCPVSNGYLPVLTELHRTYGDKGVAFVGVVASEDEDAATLARQVKESGLPFPVCRDQRHAAVTAFKANVASEAFLLDAGLVLRYRGRIDDGYRDRLEPNPRTTRHDLQQALDELLAGKEVSEPATTAVGCALVRSAPAAATGKVTYHRDVLPILQNHCQACHRPGEVGPFALLTYKQAVNWAADIKEYTRSRRMPPWKPTEGLTFRGERKLTDAEIRTLAAWADGGTPEGDPKDAPPPRQFPDGWQLGKPDLVLAPDEDMTIGPSGGDLFRAFVLPTGLAEDKYVVAYEVRPSNRRVVHHTLHFIDPDGRGRAWQKREQERPKAEWEKDAGPGYPAAMGPGFLPRGDVGGWAPGITAHPLPDGVGYYLPKGSDIVLHVHYHRTGRVEKDRPTLGLYFAKKPAKEIMQPLVLAGWLTYIPAGAEDHKVRGSVWAAQDCTLYTVTPHMHMIGRKIRATMTPPEGKTVPLIGIDDWDFNWQEMYHFKEPVKVKSGTRFDLEAVYDNSARNPNNPSKPPRLVLVGEQTTNEMCFVFFNGTSAVPGALGFRLSENGFTIRPPALWPKDR
jgi:mono/diheme cytochrome c family protein